MLSHPFYYMRVRLATRAKLREQGYRPREIDDLLDGATSDVIDHAATLASAEPPKMGAIGDGSILAAIIAFIQSPAGQALIAALLKLLVGV